MKIRIDGPSINFLRLIVLKPLVLGPIVLKATVLGPIILKPTVLGSSVHLSSMGISCF